jgi:DNA-directed RNA polymerase subunit RPC12/RpoP
MINWICVNCRKETKHRMKETDQDSFKDHKILICQKCGTKEMVPVRVLDKDKKTDFTISESVGADGGFDREVDPDCESGICGAR